MQDWCMCFFLEGKWLFNDEWVFFQWSLSIYFGVFVEWTIDVFLRCKLDDVDVAVHNLCMWYCFEMSECLSMYIYDEVLQDHAWVFWIFCVAQCLYFDSCMDSCCCKMYSSCLDDSLALITVVILLCCLGSIVNLCRSLGCCQLRDTRRVWSV